MSNVCILCKGDLMIRVFPVRKNGGRICWMLQCESCGSRQFESIPDPEDICQAHDERHHGKHASKFHFPGIEYFLDIFRRYRAERLAARLGRTGKVLDFGCGNGRFLFHLAQRGNFTLIGTELPGRLAEQAAMESGARILTGNLEKDQEILANLDAITMFHVLEHLPHPAETLRTCKGYLKGGGYLMITIPNITSLQAKIFGSYWLHLDPDRHIFFPAPKALNEFLHSEGLELVHSHTFSLEQNPFGLAQSILNLFSRERDLLFSAMKGIHQPKKMKAIGLHYAFFFLCYPFFALMDRVVGLWHKGATMTLIYRKLL